MKQLQTKKQKSVSFHIATFNHTKNANEEITETLNVHSIVSIQVKALEHDLFGRSVQMST